MSLDAHDLRSTLHREADEIPTTTSHAVYRQQVGVPFRRLYLRQPILVAVRRGQKIMDVGGRTLRCDAGGVVVASAGCFADVTNVPDAEGLYEADAFAFGTDLLSATPNPLPGMARSGSFMPPAEFSVTLAGARDALSGTGMLPWSVIVHRVGELLAWAREFGIAPTVGDPDHLPVRVRAIISANPARDWRIAEIAAALAMSEPTLRRHLASAGTSASDIIADIRLTQALAQLQTTNTSVTQIALDAGYDSPSRFAGRFRARFGLSPGEIRGRKPRPDRIGTEFDRTGVAAE